jgi:hypothetical protein
LRFELLVDFLELWRKSCRVHACIILCYYIVSDYIRLCQSVCEC